MYIGRNIDRDQAKTVCKLTNSTSKKLEPVLASLTCPKLKGLLGAFILSATSIAWVGGMSSAVAQEVIDDRPTVIDQIEDAYYTFDQPFYFNRRFPRNTFWFLLSFPENEIAGDGRVSHKLYNELMMQQNTSDPTLRTADLPTPFTSSLQSDAIFTEEPVPAAPFAPSFRQSPSVAPTVIDSGADRTVQEAPVPALW
ncbi:MAG: hypothetical protein KME15_15075 [Drouetiella hepatica Uher 2000/2452]|jgi:hypothetical protein|uniref:Uncharacterized protein n=1 Tax=Drouetiella hepatica Uher 2000/2452 TaxID=904376 RepID=A0A951QCM4_9CYAN|nr:hypothetical protein [Drouetiella hepatica Uher 2000/2452]